jgi:hypothetical protein
MKTLWAGGPGFESRRHHHIGGVPRPCVFCKSEADSSHETVCGRAIGVRSFTYLWGGA